MKNSSIRSATSDTRRPDGWSRRLQRKTLGVAGVLAVGAMAACGGGSDSTAANGDNPEVGGGGQPIAEMTWATNSDVPSLDPLYAFDFSSLVIVPNLTESLLRLDVDGQPEPNLASEWEYVDTRTLVLQLRDDVNFTDGSKMTAEDVVYNLDRQRDPKLGSYVGYFFDHVKEIEATGEYEVTITLSQPDDRFLPSLGSTAGAIASPRFLEEHGDKAGTPSVGMVGTGPYKFVSWDKGGELVVERNDDYWNDERALQVDRFVLRVLKDEATIIEALQNGEIDGAFGERLSGRAVEQLQSTTDLSVYRAPGMGVQILDFDVEKPPTDDVRVRRAMSMALDREGILEATWGQYGEVIRGLTPPALWTYGKDVFEAAYDGYPEPEQNLDEARSLIKEAGAEGAKAELWVGSPVTADQAVIVQQAGEDIGLDIEVRRADTAEYQEALANDGKPNPYNMSIANYVADLADPPGLLLFKFACDGGGNSNSYCNEDVDDLFADAAAEPDTTRRAELVAQAEAQIVEDQPGTVLYVPDSIMVLNPDIGGYELRALWSWDSFIADFSGN